MGQVAAPDRGFSSPDSEIDADVDFSAVESTSEQFNPDQPALRSEQSTSEQRTASNGPQGVPGALSNQPPSPATEQSMVRIPRSSAGSRLASPWP